MLLWKRLLITNWNVEHAIPEAFGEYAVAGYYIKERERETDRQRHEQNFLGVSCTVGYLISVQA